MTPTLKRDASPRLTRIGQYAGGWEMACRPQPRLPETVISNASLLTSGTITTHQGCCANDPGPADRRRGPCAVCIDDDADFISILDRHLRDMGVAVIGATNAINGMRAVIRERPDLVITDYYMPNAFGTYVLRRLQQDGPVKKVPVIVITGCDVIARIDPGHRMTVEQQLRQLGAASILRKPVNRHALTCAVSQCLENAPPFHGADDLE